MFWNFRLKNSANLARYAYAVILMRGTCCAVRPFSTKGRRCIAAAMNCLDLASPPATQAFPFI